jgi:hypothetical protein
MEDKQMAAQAGEPKVVAGVSREPLPASEPVSEVETLLAEIKRLEDKAHAWRLARIRAENNLHECARRLTEARTRLAALVDSR